MSPTNGHPDAGPPLPAPRPGADAGPTGRSGLAWLVRSVTHVPGVLHLRHGRLRFVSTRGVLFDDSPRALALTPARTTRGGFRLMVGDERVRLHVVRFAGAVDVPAELCEREGTGGLVTSGEATAGAVWRRLLADADTTRHTTRETAAARRDTTPRPGLTDLTAPPHARAWRPARSRRSCAGPGRSY